MIFCHGGLVRGDCEVSRHAAGLKLHAGGMAFTCQCAYANPV
jgi:hypothetical protein